jgi:hypothetical protein
MRVTTCFTGRSKEKDWEGAFREPIDRAIVAGGDGTVSRLAPWLAGRNTAFCILPLGTANNCARGLGQMHSIETIITQLNSAPIRKIDLGAITSSAGHRFFIERPVLAFCLWITLSWFESMQGSLLILNDLRVKILRIKIGVAHL